MQKYNVTLPSSQLLTSDRQQNLRNLLRDYYTTLTQHLKTEHKDYQSALRLNKKILETKGEVSNERREKVEMIQNSFEKLLSSAQTMSDLLNEKLPEFPKDEQIQTGGVILDMIDDSGDSLMDPWGDDETKSFYTDLPDLRIFLPNYAPKLQTIQPEEPVITEEVLDMEIEPEQLEIDEQVVLADDFGKSGTPEPVVSEESVLPSTSTAAGSSTGSGAGSGSGGGHGTRQQFEIFLNNLANCVNTELIDSAAIEFLLNLNTKNNRKKLTSALFGVQRYHIYKLISITQII